MSRTREIDLTLPLDRFTLEVAWSSDEPAIGLFGPSGAGKTSLLETLAGLRNGADGTIRVAGRTWLDTARGLRLPPELRGVGYVPQDARLFPHWTVRGNLEAGARRAARLPGRRIALERVVEVLELGGRDNDPVASLSGGERQRVALGRALLSGPDILLLDEPLAGADAALRRRLIGHLLRAQEEFAVPSLVVSHDATEVRLLAREAIVIERGKVAARGRPDDLFAGASIGALAWGEHYENVLHARVVTAGGATANAEIEPGLRLTVPGRGLVPGQPIAVVVRAEEIIVAVESPHGLSAQNVLPATILERRPTSAATTGDPGDPGERGGESVAVVTAVGRDATRVIAALTAQACDRLGLVPGRPVHLVMKTHSCRVYPALPHNVAPLRGGEP